MTLDPRGTTPDRAAAPSADGAPGHAALRLALPAMGTRFELVLPVDASTGGAVDGGQAAQSAEREAGRREREARLRAVGELALGEIAELHGLLSAFESGSVVGRINAAAGRSLVPVPRWLLPLFELAEEVREASGGAFDACVGGLMRRWGHRGELAAGDGGRDAAGDAWHDACQDGWDGRRGGPGPQAAGLVIDRARSAVGLSTRDGALDFGAMAKGWAIDRAMETLHEHGVRHAFLHGGTSTAAGIGRGPGGEAWTVAVPDASATGGRRVIELDGAAMSCSSPSGRWASSGHGAGGASRVGHVMDPRSGRPVPRGCSVACVSPLGGPAGAPLGGPVGASGGCWTAGALTDAWSTVVLVCGGRPASMPARITSTIGPDLGDSGADDRIG